MTTPQDPARRKKQKRRRESQLATWRAKQGAKPDVAPPKLAGKSEKKASSGDKRPG
jgi:hypothetical protein